MADESEEYTSKPTPAQIEMAKLHATAWEYAHDLLHRNADEPASARRMGVSCEQLKALAWLAQAVGGSYRRIVNGAKIDD